MSLVERALKYATAAHEGQTRRNTATPYVHHCIGVKQILENVDIQDEIILSAALLHDTMEDCQVTKLNLQELFGKDVANLVEQLTDDPTLTREERHNQQALKIKTMDERSVLIKMADRIYNLNDFSKATPQFQQTGRKGEIERAQSYSRFSINLHQAIRNKFNSCIISENYHRQYVDLDGKLCFAINRLCTILSTC